MTKTEKKRIFVCFLLALALAAGAAAVVFITRLLGGIRLCPFNRITGLNCPGCGNTRALLALLHGRFGESIKYNYAYPAEFAYLLWVGANLVKNYIKNGKFLYIPKYPIIEYIFLALLIIWWVVRNILGI